MKMSAPLSKSRFSPVKTSVHTHIPGDYISIKVTLDNYDGVTNIYKTYGATWNWSFKIAILCSSTLILFFFPLVPEEYQDSLGLYLAFGALAGLFGSTCTYPLEVVRRQSRLIIYDRVRQGTAAQDGGILPFSEIKEGDNCMLV